MVFVLAGAALAQEAAVAPCTVMVPVFTVDGAAKDVGYMFAAQVGEKKVFVTAQSLFGAAGGFATPIAPAELPTRVTKVLARDAYETKTDCGFSTQVLPVPDAAPFAAGDGSKDVAVFAVGTPEKAKERKKAALNPPLVALPFAPEAPGVDDVVYVMVPHEGRTEQMVPGKVVAVEAGSVYFKYDDATVNTTGTVGAPVVNAARQVIGINLGAGVDQGELIGAASPLAPIRERVEAAAK